MVCGTYIRRSENGTNLNWYYLKGSDNNIIAFFQQWSRSYSESSDTSDLECSNDGSLQIAYPKIQHGGYKNVEYNGMHSARHAAMINWYKVLMGTFLTVDKM